LPALKNRVDEGFSKNGIIPPFLHTAGIQLGVSGRATNRERPKTQK
jgi:hypothetical protein